MGARVEEEGAYSCGIWNGRGRKNTHKIIGWDSKNYTGKKTKITTAPLYINIIMNSP